MDKYERLTLDLCECKCSAESNNNLNFEMINNSVILKLNMYHRQNVFLAIKKAGLKCEKKVNVGGRTKLRGYKIVLQNNYVRGIFIKTLKAKGYEVIEWI